MKVVVVYEDNHGMLVIAKDYNAALRFLLTENWINDYTEVVDEDDEYCYIEERLGKNWRETLLTFDINTFNNTMYNTFRLEEMEVYE